MHRIRYQDLRAYLDSFDELRGKKVQTLSLHPGRGVYTFYDRDANGEVVTDEYGYPSETEDKLYDLFHPYEDERYGLTPMDYLNPLEDVLEPKPRVGHLLAAQLVPGYIVAIWMTLSPEDSQLRYSPSVVYYPVM